MIHVLKFNRFCLQKSDAHKIIDELYDSFHDGIAVFTIAVANHHGEEGCYVFCSDSFPVGAHQIADFVKNIIARECQADDYEDYAN